MGDQAYDLWGHSNPIRAVPPGNIQSLENTVQKKKYCNYQKFVF
jgi:hypothetical protein